MLTRALFATGVTAVVTALSVTPFQSGAGTRDTTVTVDTIVHDAALIGNLERDAHGHRVWLGGAEPHVGTIDGRRSRPLVTFDITAIPSDARIVDAQLSLDQCAIGGTPFANAARVVVDHLAAATAPDAPSRPIPPSAVARSPSPRASPPTTAACTRSPSSDSASPAPPTPPRATWPSAATATTTALRSPRPHPC
jgi:hypothetical protein